MKSIVEIRRFLAAASAMALVVFASDAFAQNGGQGDMTRDRVEDATQSQDHQQDQLHDGALQQDRDRDQLRTRIDQAPGLTPEERRQMHENLNACLALDVPAASLAAIFPEGQGNAHRVSAQTMLRLQNRVKTAAQEGVAVEPILAKAQEGRTKGVPEPALEQACVRMEKNVRAAKRIMDGAANAGIDPPQDKSQYRRMQGEVAQQMWRGMNEDGYDQLRDRAQKRLHDGSCDAADLVSAGEVATRLEEAGVKRERALRFAGDAIERGYREREMRQIQVMVAARHQRGESMDGFLGEMERCVGAGMGPGEMYSYMMRHGWMGPGDMYGPGGQQAGDTKGFGGGHDGGMGGHDGGSGGNDGGSGGGGNGKHGGGGTP